MKRLFILALALFAPLAMAQTQARHIDFTRVLLSVDGKPIMTPEAKPVPMTLGYVCVGALEAILPGENDSGIVKFNRDVLARKIYGEKDVVLSVEDISTLKERVGQVWGPAVIGAAWPLLDPSTASSPSQ